MNLQLAYDEPSAVEVADGFTQANGLPALPIVIGVVGHRDIHVADRDNVKNKLKAVFEDFKKKYPHTPLVVMSALAEGADQLAARAALEIEEGVFVRAPLPFDPAIYRQSTSFDTPEGRAQLDALLAHERVEWFVAPLPKRMARGGHDWLRVATDRTTKSQKRLRYACYSNAGAYIARRCHVLIALWDEADESRSRGPSGTAEYVTFKLTGRPPTLYPWASQERLGFRNERRLVMVMDVPRAHPQHRSGGNPGVRELFRRRDVGEPEVLVPNDKDERWRLPRKLLPLAGRVSTWSRFWYRVRASLGFGSQAAEPGESEVARLSRMKAELRQFRETCTNVDDFNADLKLPDVDAAVRRRLKDESKLLARHFDDQHNRWMLRVSRIREGAASLSGYLQPQLDSALLFVLLLLGLSVFAFHLYAHIFEHDTTYDESKHHWGFLLLFLILLVAAIGVVVADWWTRLDERRLDSRALAEALRVRRFWAMAGLSTSVADSYSGQVRSEMSWIRQALLQVCPPPRVWEDQYAGLTKAQKLELLHEVREKWVQDQCKQHQKGRKRHHEAATNLRRVGFGLAVTGWAALACLLSSPLWLPDRIEDRVRSAGRAAAAAPAVASEPTKGPAPLTPPSKAAKAPLSPEYPRDWVLIATSVLVITGGLCIAYCERLAHEDLSKQYERMALLFENGDLELKSRLLEGNVAGAQGVIEELGREAIVENAQWLILRRARQLELHIGA